MEDLFHLLVVLLPLIMAQLRRRHGQRMAALEEIRLRRQRRYRRVRAQLLRRALLMRRRYITFALMFAAAIAEQNYERARRNLWVKPRSTAVWDEMVRNLSNEEWKEHFRMRRETFNYMCNLLRPELTKRDTRLRQSISVEKRLAIALWRLATNVEFRTIGAVFGVGRCTACVIVHEVTRAIASLQQRFLRFPQGDDLHDAIRGFELRWGFPQIAGAIDGTHIPIIAPTDHAGDYYNRKGYHSIVMQAVADYRYRFTDIFVGWAGSVHDARVLRNSPIYQKGEAGTLFPNMTRNINGVDVPIALVGDAAYPLLPWLLKGFSDLGHLTPQQQRFNYRLSRARMVIECAFGRLKARWRCLLKRNDTDIHKMPIMVAACCILHNICEEHNDDIQPQWLNYDEQPEVRNDRFRNHDAELVRGALVEYFEDGH